ncbi:MAG: YhbY family RNA-binding protein [Clostridiales bacterium]|jgi:RNA-binding protein|nr:YhbY family RNA-binding protein [Clostridiales bacterium]
MLTSKQRAQLRAMANNEDTIVYIGKSGITENIVKQAQDALKAREIVKCKVQENSPLSAREACEKMSELTQSEQIQVIGSRFVLYKRNPEDAKIVLVK